MFKKANQTKYGDVYECEASAFCHTDMCVMIYLQKLSTISHMFIKRVYILSCLSRIVENYLHEKVVITAYLFQIEYTGQSVDKGIV